MLDLRAKLQKTREGFISPLKKIFQRSQPLSPEEHETVEELLHGADFGVAACERLMNLLKTTSEPLDYRSFLRKALLELLGAPPRGEREAASHPRAVVVVGVNGVGKTTSIAKLSNYFKQRGRTVLLAAADTFRAAARDQLAFWAERLDLPLVAHKEGGDPAAVAYDACSAAKAREIDYVIVDTAGRLHTRANLMEELRKIERTCERVLGPGSVDTYLTLDATLGQNSLSQAREFARSLDVRGIILTKLDSTAKGGIVVAIKQDLGIPVRFIAAGETLDDFVVFSADRFVDALLSG